MADKAYQLGALTVTPLNDALGAEVHGVDIAKPLDAQTLAHLTQAWEKHLVLRFRGLGKVSPEELIEFSRYFGTLDKRPIATGDRSPYLDMDYPELLIISNVIVDGKPIGGLGNYEADWHADMTYVEKPPKGSCLYAVEIPPSGGDTYFANMYLAYETLDAQTQQQIESLTCIHDASRNSAGELRKGFVDNDDPRKTVGPSHPLVRIHPTTGRKCLLLGRRRSAYINGLPLEESEALLDKLWAHATQPRFTWGQQWQLGDMIMWDNRCTMHYREAFDPATRRIMFRTQISGEAVTGPAA
jgi:taurine dioxygenase